MPNGKIIFPERYLSALGQVDLAEAERRFIAERGSMEVVDPGPADPAERARWKARNHLKHYGGSMTNYAVQAAAAEAFMSRYSAYAKSIGCAVVEDSIEANEEQAALLAAWWAENTGPTRRIPTEPELQEMPK